MLRDESVRFAIYGCPSGCRMAAGPFAELNHDQISERQSLTREEKFVALVHLYAELRLPFDAALDAAEADLLHEQNKGPKETARRSRMSPDGR